MTVPDQSVAAAAQAAAPSVTVDAVTAQPDRGTVIVALGPGGAAELTLRPILSGGRVQLTAVPATVLGTAVPSDRLAALPTGLAQQDGRSCPLGPRATSERVPADGLRIELTGGPGPV